MKKALALFLITIPLLSSCRKDNDFHYVFPGDNYNEKGFSYADNEKIVRSLTNEEISLVNKCVQDASELDDKILYKKSEVHERDYTLAYAGVYKEGYQISNSMMDEEIITQRIKQNDAKYKERTISNSSSIKKSIYQYGENSQSLKVDSYYYFGKKNATTELYEEQAKRDNADSLNLRVKKVENDKYTTVTDEKLVEKENTKFDEEKLKPYTHIKQSTYLYEPDSRSGADKNNNIILTIPVQKKHVDEKGQETGEYQLKDGRRFQAMDNELTVVVLTKQPKKDNEDPWCLVTYARKYKEVTITSELIQPNVPITKLKNPIKIKYSEQIDRFSNELGDYTEVTLPEYKKV